MFPSYVRGLHDLGSGHFAYLQPDGGWGHSNAGLITDGEASLLVDTLFDERLTGEMLDQMRAVAGVAADDIGALVNTHANGDHTFGNSLVRRAEIIASRAGAAEILEQPPERLAEFVRLAPQMGETGAYFLECFGAFDFAGVTLRAPTRTFDGRLDLVVGDKAVALLEVGPAHTHGDVLVHVPKDRIVYTGDILFIEGAPVMWAGPVSNWLKALDLILAMDVVAIVPGHGPVTDKEGVQRLRAYLVHITTEARKRFDAGLGAEEAALDIALDDYDSWIDAERIAVNVATLYREWEPSAPQPSIVELFARMAKVKRARRGRSF